MPTPGEKGLRRGKPGRNIQNGCRGKVQRKNDLPFANWRGGSKARTSEQDKK